MKDRCYNTESSEYHRYGGRGIHVCEEWLASFDAFYAYMGEPPSSKHSIERKDVNGNYEPGNCKWATAREQQLNKRNNNRITYLGVTKTLTEWAEETGINRKTLQTRIERLHWPLGKALGKE
jgi:hypothetical protein